MTPVNDNSPVFTSSDTVSVPENTTAVQTVTATDADLPPQAITYSIVGGADQARFGITPGGVLSFNAAPNFEAPTDANGDNTYVVIVRASDGVLTNIQAILVTVSDVFEGLSGDYNQNNVVDAADYVLWRNTLGANVTPFTGADGSGNGELNTPGQVAIDPSGNLYVVDTANNRVQKFTSAGVYVSAISGITAPRGVAVDSAGNVYVAYGGTSLRKYNSIHVAQWTVTV